MSEIKLAKVGKELLQYNSGRYMIRVAEFAGARAIIKNSDGKLIASHVFTSDSGYTFKMPTYGEYTVTVTSPNEDRKASWSTTVKLDKYGDFVYAKDKSYEQAHILKMSASDLSELCNKDDLITQMFEPGITRWKYSDDSSSGLYNYNMLIQDFVYIPEENRTEIRFCLEDTINETIGRGKQPMNPYIYYSKDGGAMKKCYSAIGSWKYSKLRQIDFLEAGSEVMLYAEGVKHNGSTLTSGIELSGYYYTDSTSDESSKIYKFKNEDGDKFVELTQDEATAVLNLYPSSDGQALGNADYTKANPLFVKGYFYELKDMTETKFNEWKGNGTHFYFMTASDYTNRKNIYTPITSQSYDSTAKYFGFYKTLQEDGQYYKDLKWLDDTGHLITMTLKQGIGCQKYSVVQSETDKVTINSTSEMFGYYIDTPFANGQSSKIRYYGDPKETETKKLKGMHYEYDAESGIVPNTMVKGTQTYVWYRSPYATTTPSFVSGSSNGIIGTTTASYLYFVRPSFQFK